MSGRGKGGKVSALASDTHWISPALQAWSLIFHVDSHDGLYRVWARAVPNVTVRFSVTISKVSLNPWVWLCYRRSSVTNMTYSHRLFAVSLVVAVWNVSRVLSMRRPAVFSRFSSRMLFGIPSHTLSMLSGEIYCCVTFDCCDWPVLQQNCHCARCRLCSKALRSHALRLRCLDEDIVSTDILFLYLFLFVCICR